jgi:hypothetical protein
MNDTRQIPMSFKLAVIATLLMPLGGLVYAIASRNWGMLAMALFWLVIYATLGYLALEGSDLARWVSCALMLGIAILPLFVTVAPAPVARGAPVARVGGGGSGGSPSVGFRSLHPSGSRSGGSAPHDPWGVIVPLFFGLVAVRLALRPLPAAE